jgi:hypothetical protein
MTPVHEDEVIARLRELVSQGEYLDDLYGRPGENLDGATMIRLDDGSAAWLGDRSRGRRHYRRGSSEYASAKAAGLIDPLPPLPPASPAAVESAERVLGAPLPPLLRRLYLEIGNGGFGPGYGILGLAGGFADDVGKSAIDEFQSFWSDAPHEPPLLPLCHWGCAIYSFVELGSADGRMWGFDPNPVGGDEAPYRQGIGLAEWLICWMDGRLYQPAVVEDPETGELRGATDAELEEWAAEFPDE